MPHHRQCLCMRVSLRVFMQVYVYVRVYICEVKWGCCVCVGISIPPSPEAVLCIVVGMAYMLTQA